MQMKGGLARQYEMFDVPAKLACPVLYDPRNFDLAVGCNTSGIVPNSVVKGIAKCQ